jgi:hypothetical protein
LPQPGLGQVSTQQPPPTPPGPHRMRPVAPQSGPDRAGR